MMINDENRKSFGKMLKSRSLYVALGITVLAAGAVGFRTANILKPATEVNTTAAERSTYKNIDEPDFHNEIAGITVPESTAVTETVTVAQTSEAFTEPSTAAVFDDDSETLDASSQSDEIPVFGLPVKGSIGLDYSMGVPVYSETMSDYRSHNGVDIQASTGGQVKAAATGKVTAVKSDSVWGNTVEIEHSGGYSTSISGLADEGLITVGSTVNSDTVIGVIGTVPVEKGEKPHIHFEVRKDGVLQDPLEVLGLTENDGEE